MEKTNEQKLTELKVENMNLTFENALLKTHLREVGTTKPAETKPVEKLHIGLGSGVNQKILDYVKNIGTEVKK